MSKHEKLNWVPEILQYAQRKKSSGLRAPWLGMIEWLIGEIDRLRGWVADLQDGGQVNCVYCGWHAGPVHALDAQPLSQKLKHHVMRCPEHPMAALQKEIHNLVIAWSCKHPEGPNTIEERIANECAADLCRLLGDYVNKEPPCQPRNNSRS